MKPSLRKFADAVRRCGSPLPNCWGFIDGTIRKISRPISGQRMMYNGKDRCHALKYQSVTTPDGIIRHLTGPYPGTMHDARMLDESGLDPVLRANMVQDGITYCLYGDPAYRKTPYLLRPFRGILLADTPEYIFNQRMARVRVTVEWGFGKLNSNWASGNFSVAQKLFQSKCGLGPQYIVMGLLTNLHTCMHGSQTSKFFNLQPPTAEEYMSGRG